MATTNNNSYEQVYNVTEEASLSPGVAIVICALVRRGLLLAGFGKARELLTLHYSGYNKNKPVWEVGFFEHLFAHEPLLADKGKVKGVFILSTKQLIVPDELYDKTQAENWLKHIHFIEQTDVINSCHLKDAKANYLFSAPVNITELVKINFKNARTLPLPIYNFGNINKQGACVQCCLTAEQVSATLHNNGKLLWHQVFDYTAAEDIAYAIMQVCAENNIAQAAISVRCNAVSAAEFSIINGLSQYFPGITSGSGGKFSTSWDGAIQLANQLISCV